MSAANWLDVMPAIPLARGVPFVTVADGGATAGVADGVVVTGGPAVLDARGIVWDDAEVRRWLRVDLDYATGFGHTLRWLRRRLGSERWNQQGFAWAVEPWLLGTTTDADRLALALACAKVQR